MHHRARVPMLRHLPRVAGPAMALASLVPTLLLSSPAGATEVFPAEEWDEVPPAEAGLLESRLDALADEVGGHGVVIHRGYLVYSWGSPTYNVNWASASKPVMATLLWMAVDQGLCSLDDTAGDFLSGGSEKDRSITLHHLANMTSGYSRGEWPGEAWAYNDVAINLFGHLLFDEIYQDTPQNVFLSQLPLGFEDPVVVSNSKIGRITDMSVRDFARIGLLWLRRGNWDGQQLIPESYFDMVTNQVPASLPVSSEDGSESWDFGTFGGSDNQLDWGPGHYGYCFWVNSGHVWPDLDANASQANGHWGVEICTVVPELDLVVASKGDWDHPSTRAMEIIVSLIEPTNPTQTGSWSELKSHFQPE